MLLRVTSQCTCWSTSAWGSELKWNKCYKKNKTFGLPLREVVSWNSHFCQVPHSWQCLPLCEVVSWNLTFFREDTTSLRSTSAWGSELKYQMLPWHYRQDQSTSAWGSELKSRMTVRAQICIRLPLREVVSWNDDLIDQIIEEHVYLCVR